MTINAFGLKKFIIKFCSSPLYHTNPKPCKSSSSPYNLNLHCFFFYLYNDKKSLHHVIITPIMYNKINIV